MSHTRPRCKRSSKSSRSKRIKRTKTAAKAARCHASSDPRETTAKRGPQTQAVTTSG